MMNTLVQDVRYALRMFVKKPGFTFTVVVALALGIGANTAIFSVVNAVLLRPLPYREPDRIVKVWEIHPNTKLRDDKANVAPANFIDWASQNEVFEQIAAYEGNRRGFNLTDAGESEHIEGSRVSASLFPLLGVQPILGRSFTEEEDRQGSNRVIILSQGFWQRRFGADREILGRTLTLNLRGYTVIGVMPEGFDMPQSVDFWVPLAFDDEEAKTRDFHYLSVIARLKPGVTVEEARAGMNVVALRLEQQYPETNARLGAHLTLLSEHLVGPIRPALLILLGAVGLVLLIACANTANLLLARAAARQKEIAIRQALGASRRRLIKQMLTESLMLSLLGGSIGAIIALWGTDLLASLGPESISGLGHIRIDARVLGFTLTLSLLTGVVFGLAPALQASRPRLNELLKEGGRSSGGAVRSRTRSLLVVSEVALSLVLLIGAGLMVKSFLRLQSVAPGFDPENLLTVKLSPTISKFRGKSEGVAFYQQVERQIQALPGVVSVGAVTHLPLSQDNLRLTFNIDGRPATAPGEEYLAEARAVSPNYFRTMSIPVLSGRDFTERDNIQSARAIIINAKMADIYWPGEDPVGKRLIMEGEKAPREIVGVVGDVKHWGLEEESRPEMYWPLYQEPLVFTSVVIRSKTDPASLAAAVRSEVKAIDNDQPVYRVRTMEQLLSRSVAAERFSMLLLAIFALVALVLAAVGIYGVIAYSVSQRTREIGIRMAMGAEARDVLGLVVRQGLRLAAAGVAIGIGGALALTRVMAGLLYGVSTTDFETFVAVPLLLTMVAALASYIPARRATKVDPMVALRYE
jgi:putative ABC transport system permease protein